MATTKSKETEITFSSKVNVELKTNRFYKGMQDNIRLKTGKKPPRLELIYSEALSVIENAPAYIHKAIEDAFTKQKQVA